MTDDAALDAIVTRGAERWGDKACIIVPEGPTVTYQGLDHAASAFAEFLLENGCSPGDRLIIANGNTPDFFIALFGGIRAGLIAVPLDAALSAAELTKIIAHCSPRAVVVDEKSAPVFRSLGVPLLAVGPIVGILSCDRQRASGDQVFGQIPRAPTAMITYTSGTTGSPKGVMQSHTGLLHKLANLKEWFGLDESYRALCILPTHFGHPLVAVCLSALNNGGTIVLSRPFDVELMPRLFAMVNQYEVNWFSTVPTIVRLLLRYFERNAPPPLPTLRFVTCASAPLHADEITAFEARFGVQLLNCYGIAEGGTWSAMSPRHRQRDHRSVGTAFGCRMRAVGSDGRVLPPDEIGELQIASPSLMLGYYEDPAATAAVVRDGWLSTGDLGRVDAEGTVFVSGRSKELIIRAGANIYPAEIEAVLLSHPEVAEAHVVGIDHPILGEAVAACVVRKAGAQMTVVDLLNHCRGLLAQYKWPQELRFVDHVTKTSRGKVNKASLKGLFGPGQS